MSEKSCQCCGIKLMIKYPHIIRAFIRDIVKALFSEAMFSINEYGYLNYQLKRADIVITKWLSNL